LDSKTFFSKKKLKFRSRTSDPARKFKCTTAAREMSLIFCTIVYCNCFSFFRIILNCYFCAFVLLCTSFLYNKFSAPVFSFLSCILLDPLTRVQMYPCIIVCLYPCILTPLYHYIQVICNACLLYITVSLYPRIFIFVSLRPKPSHLTIIRYFDILVLLYPFIFFIKV